MRHFDGERAHYSGDVRRCSGTFAWKEKTAKTQEKEKRPILAELLFKRCPIIPFGVRDFLVIQVRKLTAALVRRKFAAVLMNHGQE